MQKNSRGIVKTLDEITNLVKTKQKIKSSGNYQSIKLKINASEHGLVRTVHSLYINLQNNNNGSLTLALTEKII